MESPWFGLIFVCVTLAEFTPAENETTLDTVTASSQLFCGPEECHNVTVDEEISSEGFSSTEMTLGTSNVENETSPPSYATPSSTKSPTTTDGTTAATTPTSNSTPALPSVPKKHNLEDSCFCDITLDSCDINCCCDVDCSDADRKAFSHCIPEPDSGHSGLCYKQQFLYKNNTRYKVLQQEKGVFCIARDNFPERLFFSNQKTIHSTSSFNRAMKRKRQFLWPLKLDLKRQAFDTPTLYKSGTPVWVYNNETNSFKTLEIPLTSGTASCKSSRTIKYLEDFDSRCLHSTYAKDECEDPLSTLNGQLFCQNVVLVANPKMINLTKVEDSPEDTFIIMRTVICENDSDCEEVRNASSPLYEPSTNLCMNAVTSVQYVIYHNASNGIVDAECKIVYGTFTMGKPFTQRHSVLFKWAKNGTEGFPRSGMPGYLLGKPLISGHLLTAVSDSVKRETVNVSNHIKEWFGIPTADKDGLCSGKRNVLFKENVRAQCFLPVSRDALLSHDGCSILKDEIWGLIFGDMKVNRTDPRQLQTLVSAFGDPSPNSPEDWVPIFLDRSLEDQPAQAPCPTQISGVQYRVLYSYFGPFSNPQMKIIGLYAVVNTRDVECKVGGCKMKIVTSVNFLDVSQQAVNKFAKAPIVKIRLPPDFFYPFSSASCRNTSNFVGLAFVFMITMFLNLFFMLNITWQM